MKIEISGPVLYGLFKYLAGSSAKTDLKEIIFHDNYAYVTDQCSCVREELTKSDIRGFVVMMVPEKVSLLALKKMVFVTIEFNNEVASFYCGLDSYTFKYHENPKFNPRAVFENMPTNTGAFHGFSFKELKRVVESRPTAKDKDVNFKTDGGPLYNCSGTRVEVMTLLRGK